MKTIILTLSIMTILVTGVIAPSLGDAFALKANNSEKLSPKAYGQKTINAKCGENDCFVKQSNSSEHPSKIAKKTWSDQRTEMFMKIYQQTLGLIVP